MDGGSIPPAPPHVVKTYVHIVVHAVVHLLLICDVHIRCTYSTATRVVKGFTTHNFEKDCLFVLCGQVH